MTLALEITGLTTKVGDLTILKALDLVVPFGEVHALMGPNGSGKSTLCHALMGKAGYESMGSALVDGSELLGLPVDERARLGLFQAFQYPVDVPGVTIDDLVDEIGRLVSLAGNGFRSRVDAAVARLKMDPFRARAINQGLSGGEKKRSEMFQLAVASPKIAILDEIDSGLDIDAVREVAELVEALRSPELGILIITHYSRIFQHLTPDRVHVMVDGQIARSGGPEVADELEDQGYEELRKEVGLPPAETEDPFAGLP